MTHGANVKSLMLLLFCIMCTGTLLGITDGRWGPTTVRGQCFSFSDLLFYWVWLMLQQEHLGVGAKDQQE